VIGRQHPPEVAGTVGFFRFVEAVAADTEGARAFRARFRVLCVPLVNPDGVHEGQWRSTLGAVDTNRDWGPFSQAETRAVRDAILAFTRGAGRTPRLLLDFHATAKDIFYVPPDDALLDPPHFASRWLAAIEKRFPDYAVESNAKNNVNEWTFKRWAFETFGAPGITYELGAATPHERIARIVPGAAEEAMRLLLAEPAPGAAPGAAKAEPSAVGSR
jgi:predicted deacylase